MNQQRYDFFRTDLDGSAIELLFQLSAPDSVARAIQVDAGDNRIYWTSHITDGVWRANLDGTNAELLTADDTGRIAIDTVAGKLYRNSIGGGIYRANLDGTGEELLHPEFYMDLALDPTDEVDVTAIHCAQVPALGKLGVLTLALALLGLSGFAVRRRAAS